jgi:hypothetical protein
VLTDAEIAERSARAVRAAADAGRALGLTVRDPAPIYDVFSVVVHLAPAPVVVRVPTVLPRTWSHEVQDAQQRHELAVTGWLAEQGFPVVPPSPLVPAEPVRRDGFSMTFWQRVDVLADDPLDADAGRPALAAELHAALRGYPHELPWLIPLDDSVPDGFARLADRPDLLDPADLDRARREWALLSRVLGSPDAFAAEFPGFAPQPVHGDAPTYNMLATPEGVLCADFEHVTLGLPEWDMVGIDAGDRAVYEAVADRPLDDRLLAVLGAARGLQLVACLALADELPVLVEGLRPWLASWRESPPAGGLS